ncbi:hypothetical protein EIP91_004260 [Steccherinum ochraceum]|uniref:DH domain-containing protein n=1 Tax=Steccherinum ochraceum TaxID=92696 RepID=A0A4R0RC83_9APHY|nr:hypothetical protein EIP91_004260 [Steccherinum ochraceum]
MAATLVDSAPTAFDTTHHRVDQHFAQTRQSRLVALMSSQAHPGALPHRLPLISDNPERARNSSASDPGHSTTLSRHTASASYHSSALSSHPLHNSVPHTSRLPPGPGQNLRTRTALPDTEDDLEDAEREDGPPSELHSVAASSSSCSPPIPPRRTDSLPHHRSAVKPRTVSIVTPDEQRSSIYRDHYSASEPGHGSTASSSTRDYHALGPKPFSIRRHPPSAFPHPQNPSLNSLEHNTLRLHQRASDADLSQKRKTHVFAMSHASAVQDQYYEQSLYRSVSTLSVAKSSRNKLRKAPPSSHGRSLSIDEGQAYAAARASKSALTLDLTHAPSDAQRTRENHPRQRADSEIGYLSETEKRMSVVSSRRATADYYPSFTSTASQTQLLQIPTTMPPTRQATLSSTASSSSTSPERGRRPRHPTFRSSSTSAHTSLSMSSGGSASTAPTSVSLHEMSSSDWAGRMASGVGAGDEELSVVVQRSSRAGRSRSTPRKLLKKRTPPTPSSAHSRLSPPQSPPPPLPTSVPSSPTQQKAKTKRSKSFLGLRLSFSKGKDRDERPSFDEQRDRFGLPSLRVSEPMWVNSGQLENPSHQQRPTSWFRRTSTHALESLAMTDPHALSSSAVAELTSRLSMVEPSGGQEGVFEFDMRSPDGSLLGHGHDGDGGNAFDPYRGVSASDEGKARPRPLKERKQLFREGAVGETMRRWTLAMTDVPDEVLLDELERLRRGGPAASSQGHSLPATRRGSVEGSTGEENWVEFGMTARNGKRKSMTVSGHEFVYGGPSRKKGQFNVGGEEDEEDECSVDDASSVSSSLEAGDNDDEPHHFNHELSPIIASPSSDTDWTTARRALLCCRDVIRTERSYLTHLHQLTEIAYPSSSSAFASLVSSRTRMIIYTYLPDLIRASEAFLARLEDDPSAWGVSAALIGCEEEIESAFVRWCGVVGEVFTDAASNPSSPPPESTGIRSRVGSTVGFGMKGRSKSGLGMGELQSVYTEKQRPVSYYDGIISPSQSSTFPAPPKSPPRPSTGLFTAALGTGLAFGLSPPNHYSQLNPGTTTTTASKPNGSGTLSRTLTHWRRKSTLSQSVSSLPALSKTKEKERKWKGGSLAKVGSGRKVVSVRELAIQPTQRVTRYVLQYRDLLNHTPVSSPSRALVERALEAALKMAQRCDRAQGNSAFLRM